MQAYTQVHTPLGTHPSAAAKKRDKSVGSLQLREVSAAPVRVEATRYCQHAVCVLLLLMALSDVLLQLEPRRSHPKGSEHNLSPPRGWITSLLPLTRASPALCIFVELLECAFTVVHAAWPWPCCVLLHSALRNA